MPTGENIKKSLSKWKRLRLNLGKEATKSACVKRCECRKICNWHGHSFGHGEKHWLEGEALGKLDAIFEEIGEISPNIDNMRKDVN